MSDGASVLAASLASQGVKYMFGAGMLASPSHYRSCGHSRDRDCCCRAAAWCGSRHCLTRAPGIQYIGMRNEQAASYAASAVGYLTDRCVEQMSGDVQHCVG